MRRLIFRMFFLAVFCLVGGCAGKSAVSGPPPPVAQQDVVNQAEAVVKSMRRNPEFAALEPYIKVSKGVLIYPGLIKAGFFVGGEGGNGVLLARDVDGIWSYPAFYTLGSGSFGLQFGVRQTSVVMVFLTQESFNRAVDTGFTIGLDARVAAGTLDAGGEVSTKSAPSDIVYFAESSGVFAGISLDGGVVGIRNSYNEQYYNAPGITPRQIVLERQYANPDADGLIRALP